MNAINLPVEFRKFANLDGVYAKFVYVPLAIEHGVPSGYACQAQFEADRKNGFHTYDAQVQR